MRKKMADVGGHFLCNVFKMSEKWCCKIENYVKTIAE